ncbi:MAG: DNA polymerase I [Proteobacteria bacterium]|nr:DNA polymerase I [Pseudomonadota bacterium]
MPQAPVLYLVDISSFIHRAWHALPELSTSRGQPTGAVYGVVNMLLKVLDDKSPEAMVLAYDSKGPTLRHAIYTDYKANRPPMPPDLVSQIPLIKECARKMGLFSVEAPGFEADDLIATLAVRAQKQGLEVLIVSGDKDLYQLVDDQVTMWDPMKDVVYTPEAVEKKVGVGPDQVVDLMALAGDNSDNVPGVPRVGIKTAAKLLKEFGDLEALLGRLGEVKQPALRKNLMDNAEQARLSRELVRLRRDAPIEFEPDKYAVDEPDQDELVELFGRLEFSRLIQRLRAGKAPRAAPVSIVSGVADLAPELDAAGRAGTLALWAFGEPANAVAGDLTGLGLMVPDRQPVYAPLADLQEAWGPVGQALADPGVGIVGHGLKNLYLAAFARGLAVGGDTFDIEVAAYLLDPDRTNYPPEHVARRYGHLEIAAAGDVLGTGVKAITPDQVEVAEAARLAGGIAQGSLAARDSLAAALKEVELTALFEDVETPLTRVLSRMEGRGVLLDTDALAEMSIELGRRMEERQRTIFELAGREFNVNSPKQLGEVLFQELGLTPVKKTAKGGGASTDSAVLGQLAREHPLPAEVLEYRQAMKLKSTYVDALPPLVNPVTGRLHTTFHQTVTSTGRLSSSNPNLQNIPIRTEEGRRIRQAFVPADGKVFVSADYSQIELRVLAHLSGDAVLIEAFKSGEDVHTRTAAEVFGIMPGLVTPEMRRQSKVINFGVLYGMSAFRLSNELGINRKTAQEFIDNYFARMPAVREWMSKTLEAAKKEGFVTTLFGRRRYLPHLHNKSRPVRQNAERMALNTPIQGTAADLIKMAMVALEADLAQSHPQAAMILTVHDELLFEVPAREADRVSGRVKKIMESVTELAVPLTVEVGVGRNWDEAH